MRGLDGELVVGHHVADVDVLLVGTTDDALVGVGRGEDHVLGLGAPAGREDDDGGAVEVIGEVLVPAGLMRTVDVHVPALSTGDVPVDELVARRGEALQGVEHLVPGHLELEVGHLVGVVLEELVKGVVGDDVGRGTSPGRICTV